MQHGMPSQRGWPTLTKIAFVGFVAIAGYLLVSEHSAHLALVVPFWPVLLVVGVCGGMHLFMHHGGTHKAHSDDGELR
jgi:hypothetical protein